MVDGSNQHVSIFSIALNTCPTRARIFVGGRESLFAEFEGGSMLPEIRLPRLAGIVTISVGILTGITVLAQSVYCHAPKWFWVSIMYLR